MRNDSGRSAPTAFAIFAFTWAWAGLIHNGSTGDLFKPSVDILFTLAAWAVVLKPTSVARFAIMLAALAPSMWHHAPYITNHWIIYLFASLWLAVGGVWVAVRSGRRLPDGEAWFAYCAPALRVSLIVVYFWVTFHKLNATFFVPELSCAAEMYTWLAGKFGLPAGAWTAKPAIWGTLLAEGGIPVLLAFRRTRFFGVVFGLLFHAMLGVNGFFNFTAVVTALYVPFLGDELGQRLMRIRELAWAGEWADRATALARHPAVWIGGSVVAVAMMFIPTVTGWDAVTSRAICRYATEGVWILYTAAMLAILILAWRQGGTPYLPDASFRIGWAGAVVVAVFVVNGLSPYLGFKTENSFSMFANLRTEGSYWNHYIVPRGLRILSFQDDLVTVIASSDPWMQRMAETGEEKIFFEFRRAAAERPAESVTYRRGDRQFEVARIGDDPVLSGSVPAWQDRWLWFRPVAPARSHDLQPLRKRHG